MNTGIMRSLIAAGWLGVAWFAPAETTPALQKHPATQAALATRANPGSIDFTFDPTQGNKMIGPASLCGDITTFARQPDGKLLVGGSFAGYNGALRRHIARIHPTGALDELFHPGFGADNWIFAIALQPDGKMLVGGYFSVFDTEPRCALARLNPDGRLDTEFAPAVDRAGDPGSVLAITVQKDGKILIGGNFSRVNGERRLGVARLNADGTLDTTFNPPSGVDDYAGAVCSLWLLPDGKLLVGGRLEDRRCLLHRLNQDGSLDGVFSRELTGYELAQFAVRSDGKIYAAGYFDLGDPGWYHHQLVLLNEDGTIDSGFAVDFGDLWGGGFAALVVQPDDRLIVSGWFNAVNGVARARLARVNPDGTLDETFDPGGTLGEWYPSSSARSMLIEAEGHLWVSGQTQSPSGETVAFIRLQSNGQLDQTFYSQAGAMDLAGDSSRIMALTPYSNGCVYVGGAFDSFNNEPRSGVVRLQADGTLDHSFCPIWTNSVTVRLLTLQPDGKLLVGGDFNDLNHAGMARLHSDGTFDPSFVSPWGTVQGEEYWNMRMHCMALQADGKIIVGGEFEEGLARLNPDGSLDESFHPPYLPAYDGDAVYALAVQPDGKILFGGTGNIGLHRLHPDGELDENFNFDGQIGYMIQRIIGLPSGDIIIGGHHSVYIGGESHGLVRLYPDGRVDLSFNPRIGHSVDAFSVTSDGHLMVAAQEMWGLQPTRIYRLDLAGNVDPSFQAQVSMPYIGEAVAGIIVQANGQILIGGAFTTVNGIPMDGLARLNGSPTSWILRNLPTVYLAGEPVAVSLAATPDIGVAVYAVEDQPPSGWLVTTISHAGAFDPYTGKVKFGPFYDTEPRTLAYEVVPPVWGVHCALGVFCFNGRASADGVNSSIGGYSCMALAGYFPADINPADRQISIDEVTTYGAAWRRGSNWLCHEQGIPINYATRAAALWRLGERYTVNAMIGTEPLWWVPCERKTGSTVGFDLEEGPHPSSAERHAPGVYIPGEAMVITLSAWPNSSVMAYAVEDQVPPGWGVDNINEGGEVDPVRMAIKWGPFLDPQPRTLSYRVIPPADAYGLGNFAGSASFDGSSISVAGVRKLSPGSKLRFNVTPNTTNVTLSLFGPTNTRYRVQTSTDLIQWSTIAEVVSSANGVSLPVRIEPGGQHLFYRACALE